MTVQLLDLLLKYFAESSDLYIDNEMIESKRKNFNVFGNAQFSDVQIGIEKLIRDGYVERSDARYYVTYEGLQLYNDGNYSTLESRQKAKREFDEKKMKSELDSITVNTKTNRLTAIVGIFSTVFIILTFFQTCDSKTDIRLKEINITLKQTETSLDSLRSTIENLKPVSPFDTDSIVINQTKK